MLVLYEQESREPKRGPGWLLLVSAGIGVLAALGGLTRYAFIWMILPVLAFLILWGGRQRVTTVLTALVAFVLVLTPWMVRNYTIAAHLFGTAQYAFLETTRPFPSSSCNDH